MLKVAEICIFRRLTVRNGWEVLFMLRRSGALFDLREHRVVELAETRLTLIKGFATHIRSSIEV